MIQDDIFKDYCVESLCFLQRAEQLLEEFDAGNEAAFFYAAFELRMGIEAKLYRTIDAAMGTRNQAHKEYSATKLLKKLAEIDEAALSEGTLRFRPEGDPSASWAGLKYTPVTKKLAKAHGKLGGFLHANFFGKHPHWYRPEKSAGPQRRTLKDWRELLGEVAEELREANSGTLLAPPRFKEFIEKLDSIQESDG
jgi:hypothetical protein